MALSPNERAALARATGRVIRETRDALASEIAELKQRVRQLEDQNDELRSSAASASRVARRGSIRKSGQIGTGPKWDAETSSRARTKVFGAREIMKIPTPANCRRVERYGDTRRARGI